MLEPGQDETPPPSLRRGSVGVIAGGKEEIVVARGDRPQEEVTAFQRSGRADKLIVKRPRKGGGWQISFADELKREQGVTSEGGEIINYPVTELSSGVKYVDVPDTDRETIAWLERQKNLKEVAEAVGGSVAYEGGPEGHRRFILPRGVVTRK